MSLRISKIDMRVLISFFMFIGRCQIWNIRKERGILVWVWIYILCTKFVYLSFNLSNMCMSTKSIRVWVWVPIRKKYKYIVDIITHYDIYVKKIYQMSFNVSIGTSVMIKSTIISMCTIMIVRTDRIDMSTNLSMGTNNNKSVKVIPILLSTLPLRKYH